MGNNFLRILQSLDENTKLNSIFISKKQKWSNWFLQNFSKFTGQKIVFLCFISISHTTNQSVINSLLFFSRNFFLECSVTVLSLKSSFLVASWNIDESMLALRNIGEIMHSAYMWTKSYTWLKFLWHWLHVNLLPMCCITKCVCISCFAQNDFGHCWQECFPLSLCRKIKCLLIWSSPLVTGMAFGAGVISSLASCSSLDIPISLAIQDQYLAFNYFIWSFNGIISCCRPYL